MKPETRTHGYHHGDLPKTLLHALDEALAEHGPDALSLREVARRAGVSHGAPAHHFGDLRGLLTAYVGEAFAALAHALQAALAPDATPEDNMKRLGRAYVAFALAHPARYQLMFRGSRIDQREPTLRAHADQAFACLTHCVEQATGQRAMQPAGRAHITLAWSVVHGFSLLALDNAISSLRDQPENWGSELDAALDALAPAWSAARTNTSAATGA